MGVPMGDIFRLLETKEEVLARREQIKALLMMPEVLKIRSDSTGLHVYLRPPEPRTPIEKLWACVCPPSPQVIYIPWLQDDNRRLIML